MDAVLTWVDGTDPVLQELKNSYITDRQEDQLNDVGGPQRFIQEGEIRYAVASILRFAPFITRIFIITNNQKPPLDSFLRTNFPDNKISIHIVNQNELFRGYEEYLPVFNSIAIETMLWRIPDLSEEFIYMNDDFFFTAPAHPEDLFENGKLILYAKRFPKAWAKFLRIARRKRKDGKRRFTYKDSLVNGAQIAGLGHYYHLPHEPHPLLKSLFADFYAEHPEAIIQNIRHRFRDNEQYNVQSFGYMLAEKAGKLVHKSPRGLIIKFQPSPKKKNYIKRKLKKISKMKNLRYACMNDLRNASEEEKTLFWAWMEKLLNVKF